MEKQVYIDGMMCQHCAAHVQSALQALPGVDSVKVELENKRALLTLSAPVEPDAISAAVQDAGYTVTKIEE